MTNGGHRRVVLVAGTGHDLGRAIAEGLSEVGFSLVAETGADGGDDAERRSTNALVRDIVRRGGRATAGQHDLTSSAGARAAVDLAIETFGAIDVLVVCGALERERSLPRIEENVLTSLVSRNLVASFLCCQAVARWMTDNGRHGRMVCITGAAGAAASSFGRTHLAAAMSAVCGLVRAMSVELRPKGITVNALLPAVRALAHDEPLTADGRAATPAYQVENVVPATRFLVSEDAAEITGQVVAVSGGKLSVLRSVESSGAVAADGDWSPDEIATRWAELSR